MVFFRDKKTEREQRLLIELNKSESAIENLKAENERLRREKETLKEDNDRVYSGHRAMEEEINFLKYRIDMLSQLHESIVQQKWPHDGSMRDYCCLYPFERIEILPRGEVFSCCSADVKHNFYFGNIFNSSFDTIWNSENAVKLRKSVSTGNFEYCQSSCRFFHEAESRNKPCPLNDAEFLEFPFTDRRAFLSKQDEGYLIAADGPQVIALSCDESCNLACASCRSKVHMMSPEQSERLFDALMEKIRPLLCKAKYLEGLGSGEIFASKAVSSFLKTITKSEFPSLRLRIGTNLMLLDEKRWEEYDNLKSLDSSFYISIDGACKETYEQNRKGANWERLCHNLDVLNDIREQSDASHEVCLRFVVQKNNYQEIGRFVTFARTKKANSVEFMKLSNWGTYSDNDYRERNVADEMHPENVQFVAYFKNVLSKNEDFPIIQNII